MGDTPRKDVEPPGHALEGNVTDERAGEVRSRDVAGGGKLFGSLRALRNQPKTRLQVEAEVRGRWRGGAGGSVACSAIAPARGFVGSRGTAGRGEEEAPAVGTTKASGRCSASAPSDCAALGEHGRCDFQKARAGWQTTEGAPKRPLQGPSRPVRCAEPNLVRGLQGQLCGR